MSIKTLSSFIYGHDISGDNQFIDFTEDGIEIFAGAIDIGSYGLNEFSSKIATAMNEAGEQEYTVSLDRETRKFTISAASNFDLLITGPRGAISAYELMGFTSDKTGSNSYESDVASGVLYSPQYRLQRFIDFDDNVETAQSSVNTSASGVVEVVNFGQVNIMEGNITYVTDIVGQGIIVNNPNGVSDLRRFMNYAILKKPMEFIPDVNNLNVFTRCILESTTADKNGTGFTLNELYGRGLANYYETGKLSFRRI
jgi:hypothetical protein